jgi:hypothetical protein
MSFEPVNAKGRGNREEALLSFEAKDFQFTATLCRNLNLTEREADGRKLGALFDLRIVAVSISDPAVTHTVYKRAAHEMRPDETPYQLLRRRFSRSADGSWLVLAKEAMRAARKATAAAVQPEPTPDPYFDVTLSVTTVKTGTIRVQATDRETAVAAAKQIASDSKAVDFVEVPQTYTRSEFSLASSMEDSVLQVE